MRGLDDVELYALRDLSDDGAPPRNVSDQGDLVAAAFRLNGRGLTCINLEGQCWITPLGRLILRALTEVEV